jgi:2-keto-4-pentenoate hydratase
VTVSEAQSDLFAPASIAPQFVEARQKGVCVPGYPGGALPQTMADGYAVQDIAIDLWPDELVGWKVGLVPPQHRERLGVDRLAGCIFAKNVWDAGAEPTPFRAIPGGFCAVEAEFIIRLSKDAPEGKTEWTAEEAAEYVGELILGVEIAGSPLKTINELGPPIVVSDFGNNDGQILGPVIENWREIGGVISTICSALFLFTIAVFNMVVLVAWLVPVAVAMWRYKTQDVFASYLPLPCAIACGLLYIVLSKVAARDAIAVRA